MPTKNGVWPERRRQPPDSAECECDYHDGWHGCLTGNKALVDRLRADREELVAALKRIVAGDFLQSIGMQAEAEALLARVGK